MPIFEQGQFHENAIKYKRGLYTSLVKAGHQVFELDYLDRPRNQLYLETAFLIETYHPDMVLAQFHGADIFTPDQLAALRSLNPDAKWICWSGDSWLHSLTSPEIIAMLHHFDLQTVAAIDVLPEYEKLGIPARFWQIGYEPSVMALPEMPTYDIVFMGNVINEKRRAMLEMLRTLPYKVGIYGDWQYADGHNTYNFAEGEALYKNARLAIADNVYQDQSAYISNRPIQIMMAGGALCLHQRVDKMKLLSHDWCHQSHYIEWADLDNLRAQIDFWMDNKREYERREIVARAKRHCEQYHTYDARVRQLFTDFLPSLAG